MTEPPDAACRRRLVSDVPGPLFALLFCSLDALNVETEGATSPLIQNALDFISKSGLTIANEWLPYPEIDFDNPDYKVYSALVLRVNILESYCRGMRQKQTQRSDIAASTRRTAQEQRKRSRRNQSSATPTALQNVEMDRKTAADYTPPDPGDIASDIDGYSHYLHMWMDAHLLLCNVIEMLGIPPQDGQDELRVILELYHPSGSTVFHEGELPDLVSRIEACSFFEDTSAEKDPITHMLSKAIPQRCVVRDVISIVETRCVEQEEMFYVFQAMIAASSLGIYRHSRQKPALKERLRLYKFFFFVPPVHVSKIIDAYRRTRGVTKSREREFRAEFAQPKNPQVILGDYAAQIKEKKDSYTILGPEDAARRSLIYAWLASTSVKAESSKTKKKYIHQDVVVNVVREYIIFTMRFLPHLYKELCLRTGWLNWQHSVIDCMDAMRGTPGVQGCLKSVVPGTLPSKTLYQVEKERFIDAVVASCRSFLDSGRADKQDKKVVASDIHGSEMPVDAIFTPEMDVMLRKMLAEYPRGINVYPVVTVPGAEATTESIQSDFVEKGRFPLRLFYASNTVIREYCAAEKNYDKSPSTSEAAGLVRYLSETSMYQFQVINAFVAALVDRESIYTIALPKHLADAQASVMRERVGISDDQPLPTHLLTTFVCRHCRAFRGALVGPAAAGTRELPMLGSDYVGFANSCIEVQVANALRLRGSIPTYEELSREGKKYGTLFAYYKDHADIDGDMSIYPPDPAAYNAVAGDFEKAEAWFEALDDEPEFSISDIPMALIPSPHSSRDELPDTLVAFDANDVKGETAFRHRWADVMQRRFITGHASDNPLDPTVIWICASKRYNAEERKTRQVRFTDQKVVDAITPREKVAAQRRMNNKRRQDMRSYYRYSMCRQSRLIEVNMLGQALVLDGTMFIACCACHGYTEMQHAHWYNDLIICTRCWKRTQLGDISSLGVNVAIRCRQCKQVYQSGAKFYSAQVYDEMIKRFVDVHFCGRHARKKNWIFVSPNYQSLTTVDAGIKAGWTLSKHWNPNRDYLRDEFEEEDDELLLEQARQAVGTAVIDEDGEVGGEVADDASEGAEVASKGKGKEKASGPIKKSKSRLDMPPPKRRVIGTRRGKNVGL